MDASVLRRGLCVGGQAVVSLFREQCEARLHWGKAGWPRYAPCFDGAKEYPDTWCHFGCAVQARFPAAQRYIAHLVFDQLHMVLWWRQGVPRQLVLLWPFWQGRPVLRHLITLNIKCMMPCVF